MVFIQFKLTDGCILPGADELGGLSPIRRLQEIFNIL